MTRVFHKLIRHPVYAGFALAFWAIPRMRTIVRALRFRGWSRFLAQFSTFVASHFCSDTRLDPSKMDVE